MNEYAASAEKLVEDSRKGDELSRALRWSLTAHVILLAGFIVKSLVFPGNSEPLKIVPTLRVDIVGLPDVLKKDLPQFAPPPSANQLSNQLKSAARDAREVKDSIQKKLPPAPKAPPVEKADPDEMVLKPKAIQSKDREKKLRSAMDRIRALEKISRDVENQAPVKSKSAKSAVVIKGNALSKGTSLTGEARESAVASYYENLRDRIASNWTLPVWLLRQNFSAQVRIFIDARGHIKGYSFTRSSGNAQFDEEVKRALAESDPVPTPPEGIAASLSTNGIPVNFPL